MSEICSYAFLLICWKPEEIEITANCNSFLIFTSARGVGALVNGLWARRSWNVRSTRHFDRCRMAGSWCASFIFRYWLPTVLGSVTEWPTSRISMDVLQVSKCLDYRQPVKLWHVWASCRCAFHFYANPAEMALEIDVFEVDKDYQWGLWSCRCQAGMYECRNDDDDMSCTENIIYGRSYIFAV